MAYSSIRPKSQISNIGHDGTSSIRNFLLMVKIPKGPNFEPHAPLAYGHNPAIVPILTISHDGILSFRNFVLDVIQPKNLNFELIKLPALKIMIVSARHLIIH